MSINKTFDRNVDRHLFSQILLLVALSFSPHADVPLSHVKKIPTTIFVSAKTPAHLPIKCQCCPYIETSQLIWVILVPKMAHPHKSGSALRIYLKFCRMKGANRYMEILLVVFPEKNHLGQFDLFSL